jgi:hypothetical protein
MEKQMGTFNGAMSNLQDTVFQTMAAIGDGGLTDSVGRLVQMLTSGMSAITPILVGVGNAMAGILNGVAAIGSGLGSMFSGLNTGGSQGLSLIEGFTVALNLTGQAAQVVGNIIGASFGAAGQVIGAVVGGVKDMFAGLWSWLTGSTSAATSSMGLSFLGVLRAGKYLTENLPKMFSAALGAIGGMFSVIGNRIASFLSGDWNAFAGIGGALAGQFKAAEGVIGGIVSKASAIAKDSKGAADAWERLKGNTGKKGGLSLDQLAGAAPVGSPTAGKGGGDDAAKKAGERLKREQEFWQALKDQTAAAGMLTLEAENYNKGLELRKILERDLTATEQGRVASALSEINTAKAITSLKQAQFEAANEYTVELGRAKGLTDAQKAVEDQLFKMRLDALNRGVAINNVAYKQAEDQLRSQLDKNAALKAQNELLSKAMDFARRYSSALDSTFEAKNLQDQREAFLKAFDEGSMKDAFGKSITPAMRDSVLAGVDQALAEIARKPLAALADSSLTARASNDRARATDQFRVDSANLEAARSMLDPEAFRRTSQEIARTYGDAMTRANRLVADDFIDNFSDGINEIADLFGGAFGNLLRSFDDAMRRTQANANGTSGIARMLGMIDPKLAEGFQSGSGSMMNLRDGFKSLSDPLKGLRDDFRPGGSILKGMGKAMGGAMAGYEIGSQVGGLMSSLGIKGSGTGAKIGGTIGGLTGNPVIAAGASVIGGLIGSAFYKAPNGSATLSGTAPAMITGNNAAMKKAAAGAAGSVQAGLAEIASALGGSVGAFDVMIGQHNGKWRVRDTSTGWNGKGGMNFKGDSAKGLRDFGDDADAAIKYAIENAISDGALQGLSDIARKAVNVLGVDSAISFVQQFNEVMRDFDALKDPITGAVKAIITPLDQLRETMLKVGASTEDLTKIDEYRAIKLKDVLKSQTQSLNEFLNSLKGEGSGVTKLDRLNANLTKFADYQSKIAAGDSSVDQSAFTSLGQDIFSLARDVYGTATSQFQDIRALLTGSTTGLLTNVTNAFNSAGGANVASAVQAGSQAMVSEQVITNALLRKLIEQNIGTGSGDSFAYMDSMNGRYGGNLY